MKGDTVPFPTPSAPVGSPAGWRRPARRIVPLLVVSVVLAGCAATLGPTAGLAVLLAAAAALLAAAVVGARAQWTATLAGEAAVAPTASPLERVPGDVLAVQLRGLQQRTADKVSRALHDGREDLARELSDSYADDALRAITAAGLPPA
jgi:hypothetical protein